jgi:murein DD-endopeptidase MepM/ murein hydrolase activator NlpD
MMQIERSACRALAATLLVSSGFLNGCGSGSGSDDDGEGPPSVINPEPAAANTVIRLFARPFESEYPLLNYFDHDRPVAPNDSNGHQLTWRGARAVPGRDIGGYDGHSGIDWLLPKGTPVFAVTHSEVVFAGGHTFNCWLEGNREVTNITVTLKFIAPDGQTYFLTYTHLDRVDVAVGDWVSEGQQVGLSGDSGCIGTGRLAHLHFELRRLVSNSPEETVPIDPYGWEGSMLDPWVTDDPQKASYWFWKEGQAPDMMRP